MRMRTFHHFWVMLVAGCVDADPLSRGDTDAGLLITDAGLLIADAGTFDDAGEDLLRPDAGPPDAGVLDQGCVFGDNPQFIFTCEGDEDFCDEEHDTPLPATDMVALWSHISGADFVVDIRLGAMPFRSASTSIFTYAIGSSTENSVYSNCVDSGLCGWSIPVKLTVDYGDVAPPLFSFPPTWFWPQPIDLAVQYSQCDFFEVSRSQPLLRLRVPIGLLELSDNQVPKYTVFSTRPNLGGITPFTTDDVYAGNGEQLLTSSGGEPNDVDDWVNICEFMCEEAGGELMLE